MEWEAQNMITKYLSPIWLSSSDMKFLVILKGEGKTFKAFSPLFTFIQQEHQIIFFLTSIPL